MLSAQEPRYYFCFKCTTVQKNDAQNKKTSGQSKRLRMRPCGYAKISTPIEKLIKIIGDILLAKNPNQKRQDMVLNPLVEYFIFRIIAYDFITPGFKLTSYKQIMKNMFEGAIRSLPGDKSDDIALKKLMLSEMIKTFDAIFEGYINNPELPRWRPSYNRADLLQKYKMVCEKSKEQNKTNYLKIVEKYLKQLGKQKYKRDYSISTRNNKPNRKTYFFEEISEAQIERFVEAEFEEVGKVQVLNRQLQLNRLLKYAKKNKGYFNFQVSQINYNNPQSTQCLTFDAISKEKEPILLTIQDYVELRQENCNYQEESQKLIIDLLQELHRYRNQILESEPQSPQFYHYLSPTSAIIDQLSLTPKLSFLPCVEDAFGIMVKPHSVELKLVFSNTPKTFDYFQSQKQLNQSISYLLKDPYYGTEQVLLERNEERIENSKEENNVGLIYQSICVDRFLLLCHLITTNNVFGKGDNNLTTKQRKEYFQKQFWKKKRQIARQSKALSTFVGQKLVKLQNQKDPFNFTLAQLTEILNTTPEDSQVQNHRFHRFYNLSAKRHIIIREIIANFNKGHNNFTKIPKTKKYLFVLFIQYLQVLFEYMFIYKSMARNPKDVVQIYEYLKLDKETRQNPYIPLKTNIKFMAERLNIANNKNSHDKQDSENKMTKKYSQAQEYITKEHDFVTKLYQSIKNGDSNKIINIKQEVKKCYKQAVKRSEEYKNYIFQFLFTELNIRYANGPHTFGIRASQQLEAGKQVTRRLELIIYAFITSTQQNFTIYDSLVFPALKIRKKDTKNQNGDEVEIEVERIKQIKNQQEKDSILRANRYILNQVDDILDFSIELPKIYKRLRVPIGKWFNENDRSLNANQQIHTERKQQQYQQQRAKQIDYKKEKIQGRENFLRRQ